MHQRQVIKIKEPVEDRLDKYLAQILPLTRSQIQKLIKDGNIKVNGKPAKGSQRVKIGDEIEIEIPPPESTDLIPEDIKLDIIYEDEDLLIVNKPRGMVVHPACGHYSGTLVNALLHHVGSLSQIGGKIRPGIIHRLDKDTTGLILIAKNDFTHLALSEQLKNRTLKRIYWALVEGEVPWEEKRVELPIGRHPVYRKKMAVVSSGKSAISYFKVLERFKGYTLLCVNLETGRTHQIRVHLSYLGIPVVGDAIYGKKDKKFGVSGQLLHAKEIVFFHPRKREYMSFSSDLPSDFKEVLNQLRNNI
ncbi:MAG: RluA family pseudouridine synthase [Dictyoglomus sp.]|nr:RluA family pseudouridine synthase [Dictyoglomus sp.]MDW8187967.1 RluA family pseudouridine synthase [Dictyoglomus sp.]